MPLPTYYEAIARPDVLYILASYLDANLLATVSRVSRAWHDIANPLLWADPVTVISQLASPFLKFNIFIKRLKDINIDRAKNTRDLVMTLNFKPLVALKYQPVYRQQYAQFEGFITTQWVFKNIPYLRNLRFIMVDGLSVFEGAPPFWQRDDGCSRPTQVLLLSTSGMRSINSDWIIIEEAFRNVMFLDISYTTRTEDFTRLYFVYGFPNLRVLKIRGLRLTNAHLKRIAFSGHKLWSLDIRDNLLTDEAVEVLLQDYILPPIIQPAASALPSSDTGLFESPPAYEREPRVGNQPLAIVPLRPDDEVNFMQHIMLNGNLTHPDAAILDEASDMLRPTGLTHLYISGNKLTSLGIRRLLHQTNRLQILDGGSVRAAPASGFNIPYTTSMAQTDSVLPLRISCGTRLEALRIHHSVVTYTPTILPTNSSDYLVRHLHQAEIEFAPQEAAAWEALSPHSNPRIRYLCLTDIPTKSHGPILNRLKEFLALCESQQRLLESAATGIGAAHHRGPKLLTGLRTLRLEFIVDDYSETGISASEDKDADEFLAQSKADFSFFDALDAPQARPALLPLLPDVCDVVEQLREFRKTMAQRWNGKLELVTPR